jgi:AraC-like DNA-binding protein
MSRLDRVGDWAALAVKAGFDMHTLASLCGVSIRHIERYFKHCAWESPELWLKHVRLQEAQSLLRQGRSVKEVALSLRFRQVSHFCREFKRFTGSTPTGFSSTRAMGSRRAGNVVVGQQMSQ